jgi:hypothetical protein
MMICRQILVRTSPLLAMALAGALFVGCGPTKPKTKLVSRYPTLPQKEVPDYLKGTILQKTELADTGPFIVSGYGLIANLSGTGGGPYPNAVRDYMIKELVRHGIGMPSGGEFSKVKPEQALDGKNFTIAEVRGLIPPGARKKQPFDVLVNAMASSDATSLARGTLYQTDLHVLGLRETDPSGSVNVYSKAQGPIFVNPAYGLNDKSATTGGARLSLRNGVVLAGGVSMIDRPLRLQLRQPQRSTARQIEARINLYFQNDADMPRTNAVAAFTTAEAQDEGIVDVYVPRRFRGDWQHFIGIVQHLYTNASPAFAARQARILADAAVRPDARLDDISLAWEGLGAPALPFIVPLMDATKYSPAVNYAAARAAAFLEDPSAPEALLAMARQPNHPFQLTAVQTLGGLPASPGLNRMLRQLLDLPQTAVRVEAYRILARNRDSIVYTRVIDEQFILDIVPSDGPPLIYASREGLPRIALLGNRMSVQMPVTFTALNTELQISSDPANKVLKLFYRGREIGKPLAIDSLPDLAEVISRLGGDGQPGTRRFQFNYGEIVGLVQAMSDQKKIVAAVGTGATARRANTSFVLQEAGAIEDTIYSAPVIPGTGRPQAAGTNAEGRMQGGNAEGRMLSAE